MRRRPRELEHDPDRRPPHLQHFRAEDWTDVSSPPDPGFAANCAVCKYWFAQREWSETHPDAPIDLDYDMPDDPWHPELI